MYETEPENIVTSFLFERPFLFAFPVLLMFLLSAKTHGVPPPP